MSEKNTNSAPSYQKIYKTFVVTVIALIVSTQAITQYFIYTQKYDANRINIAGRQRMLSQNLTKTILKIYMQKKETANNDLAELENLKNLFIQSQDAILMGSDTFHVKENNSELALKLFVEQEVHYKYLIDTVEKVLSDKNMEESQIQDLFLHEKQFLTLMDRIVTIYSEESVTRTSRLQLLETILSIFSVIVILVEIAILYRPLVQKLAKDNEILVEQKKRLEEFSFLLSHKVRKHIANLLGLMNTMNPNNLLEVREYFQYVRQSVLELDSVSREMNVAPAPTEIIFPVNVDSTQKYETFEKLRTIMLLDDDKITNILTKKILLKYNPEMKVEVFSNPIESIQYLEKLKANNWEFPIIFLDINMPKMNGWQFLDQLANLKMNPIVYILTSSIDSTDIEKARRYKNVKAFLTKPLTQDKMPTFV